MPPSRPRLGTSLESTAPSRLQVLVGLTSWNCSFDYATERPVIEKQNVGIGEAKRWDRDRKCTTASHCRPRRHSGTPTSLKLLKLHVLRVGADYRGYKGRRGTQSGQPALSKGRRGWLQDPEVPHILDPEAELAGPLQVTKGVWGYTHWHFN